MSDYSQASTSDDTGHPGRRSPGSSQDFDAQATHLLAHTDRLLEFPNKWNVCKAGSMTLSVTSTQFFALREECDKIRKDIQVAVATVMEFRGQNAVGQTTVGQGAA
jgi:hypothetical protein